MKKLLFFLLSIVICFCFACSSSNNNSSRSLNVPNTFNSSSNFSTTKINTDNSLTSSSFFSNDTITITNNTTSNQTTISNNSSLENSTQIISLSNSSTSSSFNYGTLTILDIQVIVTKTATIQPVFSIEEMSEDITYTFNDNNISIENNIVTGLIENTTTLVTATTTHHTTTFNVSVLEIPITDLLTFTLNENSQTYTVTKVENYKTITIPNTYNTYPVTSISSNAFSQCDLLQTLTIGENITSLNTSFSNCINLTTIYFNAINLSGLNPIFIMDSSSKNISLIIGNKVQTVPRKIFQESKVTSVTFAENSVCTKIEGGAFYFCRKLYSIQIPSSVTFIGKSAFNLSSLSSAVFEDPSGWYYTQYPEFSKGNSFYNALSKPSTAANYLASTYVSYCWVK